MLDSKTPFTEPFFEGIEKEANDDFLLLDQIGAAHFGTDHLIEMRSRVIERMEMFDRHQRLGIFCGAVAAGWAFLGALAYGFGYPILSFMAFALVSLCLVGFLVNIFTLNRRFGTKGEMEHDKQVIEFELRKRKALRARP